MTASIKVAIVEDQKQTREGLGALINGTPGFSTVGMWTTMEEALSKIERDPPDVVMADIRLPGMSGIDGVRRLKSHYPSLQIVMLSVYNDNDGAAGRRHVACGIVDFHSASHQRPGHGPGGVQDV